MKRIKEKIRPNAASLFNKEPLVNASKESSSLYSYLDSDPKGLYDGSVQERLEEYGENKVVYARNNKWYVLLIKAFINPFIGILMFLALISIILDVLMAAPGEREWATVIIITTMVSLSVLIRFYQEHKSSRASEALQDLVSNTASVFRNGTTVMKEVEMTQLVPGDLIFLSAGDMVPADVRIVEAKDLFVSQSSLTGESEAVEKTAKAIPHADKKELIDLSNICFMGSTVLSGAAKAIIVATGNSTYFGTIAKSIVGEQKVSTSFDKGINQVSLLLIRFMLVMVPFVLFVNGFTKGDWFDAFLFAISVAVGLTPEMLPMIVSSNLAKGAVTLAKKKTIVKNLNAIQSFGAMNILCTDKTGTLTEDKIVLEKYLDIEGRDCLRVLRHAYFNSFFQTGLKNLMDKAILSHCNELNFQRLGEAYKKVDEIPFDFTRRRMSVIVEDQKGKRQIITKGAIEEILSICGYAEYDGQAVPITEEIRKDLLRTSSQLNKQGMRVLGVSQKSWVEKTLDFNTDDESDMVLIGYLAFLDPPKKSAADAIRALKAHGVAVKVLSGDNALICETVAQKVGINVSKILLGQEVDEMSDEKLLSVVEGVDVFAKLTPLQKSRVIESFQKKNHTVGFLGDGINDSPALKQADIGISVDTAVDVAKESADIILLEKSLMVLEEGVVEGRKIFGNIIKYIKMTASSNFGNMFSVMIASVFLPFLPMMPIHLLIQNLLYDISQITIPFDRVDEEYIRKPRKWDASDLKRFMIHVGPISSVFDIVTYLVLWFVFSYATVENQAYFHSGWFIEGLLSQTLIVHMIRTHRIPFIQSRASWPVLITTISIMIIGVFIPYSKLGATIGLVPLPWSYFPWLIGVLFGYCFLTQIVKNWYVKKFNHWL